MNNAEVIKQINMVIDGLTTLRDSIDGEEKESKDSSKKAAKPAIGSKGKSTPAAKTSAPSTSGGDKTYTVSELEGMKYNEFKKLASSLGVDCKGTRAEIMERVISTGVVSDAGGEEPAEKKTSKASGSKSNKPSKSGKSTAGKPADTSGDKFDKQAESIIAETPTEDIIDALADVGVKATKLNYKKKLVSALRDGLLEVEDGSGDNTETEGAGDMVAEDYYKEYDLSEANDPDGMTEERSAACIEKQDTILVAVANGELSADDIIEYLQTVATQEELDLLGDDYSDEDLVKLYIEVAKHFIDDDGEEHEPGEPYMVCDTPFCCGQPLAYDKATGKYLCSSCAAEYEAEEE